MSEGWRIFTEKIWGNCTLHNFPIGFNETCQDLKPTIKIQKTIVSIYSLQKSASKWNYFDFME